MASFLDTQAIAIAKNGTTVTSGATSVTVALPTNAAGIAAKVIRLVCPVTTDYAYVLAGPSTVVATTDSISITPQPLVLDVAGCTHIAYIQGSAGAKVNIVPVEW